MKLNFEALEQGLNEELAKQANVGMLGLPTSVYTQPSSVPTAPPSVPNFLGYQQGDGPVTTALNWLPEGLMLNAAKKAVTGARFSPLALGVMGTGKVQGLIEKHFPDTHKEWLQQSGKGFLPPFYKWMDNARQAYGTAVGGSRLGSAGLDVGVDFAEDVVKATGGPEATQALDNASKNSTPTMQGLTNNLRSVQQEYKGTGGPINYIKNLLSTRYDKVVQGVSDRIGEGAGRFLVPALGAGALILGANSLFGGRNKRNRFGGSGQAPVVNVNVGGAQQQQPGFFNYNRAGVQSLGSPVNVTSSYGMDNKYGMDMVKHASGVTELLAKAVQQRAINKAIDKFQEVPAHDAKETSPEEEIEITSKYPEVAKLLKDEQNKAYLDRILKD